jgi:large-conductance mechanosensitive channel
MLLQILPNLKALRYSKFIKQIIDFLLIGPGTAPTVTDIAIS